MNTDLTLKNVVTSSMIQTFAATLDEGNIKRCLEGGDSRTEALGAFGEYSELDEDKKELFVEQTLESIYTLMGTLEKYKHILS